MKRLVFLLVLVGCGKGPSRDQCTKLLDHLVDLEFKKAGASATADAQKAELAKQKQAVVTNKTKDFVAACVDRTAKDRVECALQATDLDGVAKCDDTK
ncbi:MAG: hypothetical protein WKG01_12810 [Kofleriaceae bacterium]